MPTQSQNSSPALGTTLDHAIAGVLEQFDFDAVHQAMAALGWKWQVPYSATEMEVPNVQRIREQAAELLGNVWDDNEPELESHVGGLVAWRTENSLHLQFVLRSAYVAAQEARPQFSTVSPSEQELYAASSHLARSERGRDALQGLRHMMDNSYSLDAANIQAIMTLLSGFYGSMTGTASDAVNEELGDAP